MQQHRAKISTEELAKRFLVKPESVRSALCRYGHYNGLVPVRLPNGRLGWGDEESARVANGEAA